MSAAEPSRAESVKYFVFFGGGGGGGTRDRVGVFAGTYFCSLEI